ncbi:hypothetical protein BCV70DRAFT_199446 [Testicularia cyperi]|uniref:Shr3 amino acid permease chaperone n=1 Tax=Testicularia cyperi TaxID=1882483 RepID=A0A317XS03_9BASI|nr:hypothetical protein BCV70DRAFT_199446 [Testicularia cyperi]
MGFRSGFVISSTSFLFGVIFIASNYDVPLLYFTELSDSAIEAAERFYLSMYNGPTAVAALLHGMMGLGIVGLVAKLHRWSEMAKYFDGGSLVMFMGAVCMYLGVAVPNLRLIANPNNERLLYSSSIAAQRQTQQEAFESGTSSHQPPSGPMTQDERISAIRIIAASNTISAICLLAVLVLQISEWYLEKQDNLQAEQRRIKQAAELAAPSKSSSSSSAVESKKSI